MAMVKSIVDGKIFEILPEISPRMVEIVNQSWGLNQQK